MQNANGRITIVATTQSENVNDMGVRNCHVLTYVLLPGKKDNKQKYFIINIKKGNYLWIVFEIIYD